jgi:hypothetical protein
LSFAAIYAPLFRFSLETNLHTNRDQGKNQGRKRGVDFHRLVH